MARRRTTRRTFLLSSGALVLTTACGGSESATASDAGVPDGAAPDGDVPDLSIGLDVATSPDATDGPLPDASPPDALADAGLLPFPPEPDPPWTPDAEVDLAAFLRGVQVGDVLRDAALVSVWSEVDEVVLAWARLDDGDWTALGARDPEATEAGWLQTELTDLEAGTTYAVVATTADGARRSVASRFVTPPDEARTVYFAATSCLGGNQPWPNMSHVADHRLDFFCLLGDTVYVDWSPRTSAEQKWREALQVQGLRDVCASTSLVATWDDHEVDNNWTPETVDPALAEAALAAFRKGVPQRRGPGGTGLWHHLPWGDTLDVFVLDSRGERRGEEYLSREQLDWLVTGLRESRARFKFILNSVPITDWSSIIGELEAEDRWQGFPAQRTRLLEAITDVPGVLWLTGDFHFGAVAQVDAPGGPGAGQWEVQCGPGGSEVLEYVTVLHPNEQIPILVKAYSSTLFEADPETGEVRVTFVGDDGEALAQTTIHVN